MITLRTMAANRRQDGGIGRRSLLAGGLTLAGCAGGASRRVGLPPPAAHRDGVFVMPDGLLLPYRAWLPAGTPDAVLLALHGFNDSRDAWEIPGPQLAGAGVAVYAPDQRGFGDTASRGVWPGGHALVSDALSMAASLAERHPGIRPGLLGESMGGAVAMVAATQAGPMLAGTVTAAAAVWGRPTLDVFLRTGLFLLSHGLPWVRLRDGGPIRIQASDNLSALRRLSSDPLTLHVTSLGTIGGVVDLMDAALAAAAVMPAPALMLYGGRDEVIPPQATREAWRRLPQDSGIRRAFYPRGYHLLLRDHARLLPISDIVTWLAAPDAPPQDAPLPSGADRAAVSWLDGAVRA